MDAELNDLYQQVILDHNKNPRNFGELESANHTAKGHNPLCGDQLDLYLLIIGDTISDIKFKGSGCAISKSSASIMTTLLKGKKIEEARVLFTKFHDVVTADTDTEIDEEALGKLAVFSGVREFPARVKCASLAWHTLLSALDNKTEEIVITE
ncbi:MAG: SUF system NifU family Fe-S cluster assembly protein [Ignavibacteriae bacterium]|nr:SUF system NifU family Fe-S cluster assembly protein [Ignavibacteriota bacterium]